MAAAENSVLPCLKKRDLLNDESVNVDVLIQEGQKFQDLGYLHDALELFAKAEYSEGIARILNQAIQDGDYFLAKIASRKMDSPIGQEQLIVLGEKALEEKKYSYAVRAFTMSGDEEKVKRIQDLIKEGQPD
jgi:hypothetical protein